MENLQKQVSVRVANDDRVGEPVRSTFAAIEEIAAGIGCVSPPYPRTVPSRRKVPAGLPERWFC